MGGVGDFLFGSKPKQKSTSTSTSSSASGNRAFDALMAAFGPTLNFAGNAGSMIGDLLGLNSQQTSTPAPTHTSNTISPVKNVERGSHIFQNGIPNTLVRKGVITNTNIDTPLRDGGYTRPQTPSTPTPQTPTSPSGGASTQNSALENWANSGGMQFILDQGTKAIEGSQAGRRMLQSGATGKALTKFGQNTGSTYLQQYMDNLFKHSGLGLTAGGIISDAGKFAVGSGSSSGNSSGNGGKTGMLPMIASAVAGSA